ncbi:DUF5077 domain-containing protein [Solitalea lacus]|uniref:DUF5077 domain-containing protein n=1 Tax=Solitalea lacus TaxID=2911172 RepID=UPI001EDBDD23|nr:DUF5077 domain-containing protein [Solitalea lacus]UKJ07485.1 DUF5077 domain-containing protein [Solitalea lacus]
MIGFSACKKNDIVNPSNSPNPPTPIGPKITIPLAGNAYITTMASGSHEVIVENGLADWTNAGSIASAYFRLGQIGQLTLQLKVKVAPVGNSSAIKVSVNGTAFTVNLAIYGYLEKT